MFCAPTIRERVNELVLRHYTVWFRVITSRTIKVMSGKPKIFIEEPDASGEKQYYIIGHLLEFCDVTSYDECDFVLSSKFRWGRHKFHEHQIKLDEYGKLSKKVVIFWITDCCDVFRIPENVFFFRTSVRRSKMTANDYVLPFIFLPVEVPLTILKKSQNPSVGFCGWVSKWRKQIIKNLKEDGRIDTNFVELNRFYGGSPPNKEFVENVTSTHFTVGQRGAGAFSQRFYQTLSAGRIPVLSDTDVALPLPELIEWKNIIVLSKTTRTLNECILNFYATRDIAEVQQECYDTYWNYLQPKCYFKYVFEKLLPR